MHKYIIIAFLFVCLGINAQTAKDLRDSLAVAVDELGYHPDSLDLRLKKARWNLELEQWRYACDEYDYVLKMDPQNVAALFYRAYVNEKLGRYNYARRDYQDLLAIVPGNFEGMLGLALLNQKDKHYTEALDLINKLVDRFPNRSEAYAARAGIEVERGMFSLAEYDFSEAVRLEPSNTDFLLSRYDVRIKMGNKDDARKDLDRLVELGIPRPNLKDLYNKCK